MQPSNMKIITWLLSGSLLSQVGLAQFNGTVLTIETLLCLPKTNELFIGDSGVSSATVIVGNTTWSAAPIAVTLIGGDQNTASSSSNSPVTTSTAKTTFRDAQPTKESILSSVGSFTSFGPTNQTSSGGGVSTGGPPVPSPSPSPVINPPSAQSPSASNASLSLSSAVSDTLQLALLLSNLGEYIFSSSLNSSRDVTLSIPGLAHTMANFSQQEREQQAALQATLNRAGVADILPCQYIFPNNSTELFSLMHALKVIEIGIHLSLPVSLEPNDAAAATLLSSIASVAARQDALLRTVSNSSTSWASFDTPLSGVLAYNLAQGFISPGSCVADLPIPILPTLSFNNKTVGITRAGDRITFGWDTAASAAISKTGKPLFIGWLNGVNAPVYTPLTPVGDALGATNVPVDMSGIAFAVLTAQPGIIDIDDLSDATLAGPVLVSLTS